jgi:hypothetical protein
MTMQICIAFLLVALGGGLYALHTHICRKNEKIAWQNGYMQAQKEEQMRLKAVEQFKATLPQPRPIVPTGMEEKCLTMKEAIDKGIIPPDFMDKVHTNGRAVTRLK